MRCGDVEVGEGVSGDGVKLGESVRGEDVRVGERL